MAARVGRYVLGQVEPDCSILWYQLLPMSTCGVRKKVEFSLRRYPTARMSHYLSIFRIFWFVWSTAGVYGVCVLCVQQQSASFRRVAQCDHVRLTLKFRHVQHHTAATRSTHAPSLSLSLDRPIADRLKASSTPDAVPYGAARHRNDTWHVLQRIQCECVDVPCRVVLRTARHRTTSWCERTLSIVTYKLNVIALMPLSHVK